jgi:ABC-2 type transport system permease protein
VDAESWHGQGKVNPHNAAHFGRHAFKPITALAALDPGILDYAGTMVRLEAHRQNPAGGLSTDADTSLASFPPFTVATALTVFAPVVLILAGFGTFAGATARQLLRQELAAGASPAMLLWGRILALGAGIALALLLIAVFAAALLAWQRASADDFLRLALMLGGYALYLGTVLILVVGVSAACRNARTALVVLLAGWTITSLLVPRFAPAFAERIAPVPTLPELQGDAGATFDAALDGGGPRANRMDRVRALALEQYGVQRVEDLPINYSGFALEYSERLSTVAFRKHFAELYARYDQQRQVQAALSLVAPALALKTWSSAFAGTDLKAHEQFLLAAEDYRYRLVQTLNRDYRDHPPANKSATYEADVGQITASLGDFSPPRLDWLDAWGWSWPQAAVLAGWLAAAALFASRAANQLWRNL